MLTYPAKWLRSYFVFAALIPAIGIMSTGNAEPTKLTIPEILDAHALQDGTTGKPAVEPCENFYQFACGRWMDDTEIPADKESVSHQATALLDQTDEMLNKIIVNLAINQTSKTPQPQLGASAQLLNYYNTCMNFDANSAESSKILQTRIQEISQIKTKKDLAKVLVHLHRIGASAFFSFGSGQDINDSSKVIGYVNQAGMGLPEPTYYSETDAKSVEIREQYLTHIANVFTLLGTEKTAALNAKLILDIETKLALKALPEDQAIDPEITNHPMNMQELSKLAPAFPWNNYFTELKISRPALNISEPDFIANMNELLRTTPLKDIKTYLTWHLALATGKTVNATFEQEFFHFWNMQLNGAKQMKPRWKSCTQQVEHMLGYALAEAYTNTVDTHSIRLKINEMIQTIKQIFQANLDDLTTGSNAWMDEKTKAAAIVKLNLLGQKIGAPEIWRDYSALHTDNSSFLANYIRVSEFEFNRDLAKIGKPLNRTEWLMMPWEINAYYEPGLNEFVFPFGILQAPSFDLKASDGANFGSFGGGTIGHELTHGYDSNGRKQDGYGNLVDWWSTETKNNFEKQSQCFIEQANNYRIKEVDLPVNGQLTLSENLADQGGVKLGYKGLLATQAKRSSDAKPVPLWLGKYTENQQFWIAYAQSWCTKQRPESLRSQMTTDTHPPAEFRVNGIMMNRPEFAQDFGCKPGTNMAPLKRCSIW